MPAPTQGRVRLERALISVHRAGRARGPEGRRHVVQASPRPSAERSAPAGSAPPRGEVREPEVPEAPRQEITQAPVQEAPAAEGLAEIIGRLRSIEERLAALQIPPRPAPASPELFAEWVRMRHWQEIPFGEFLKLRRAGRI